MPHARAASPRDPWIRHFDAAASEQQAEQRRLHTAAVATLMLHVLFFALRIPENRRPIEIPPDIVPFRLSEFRPRPPQPPPPRPEPLEPPPEVVEASIIVPGPPEIEIAPLEPIETPPVSDLLADLAPLEIVVPSQPPPSTTAQPVRYNSSLERPERIYSPLPPYTPAARKVRRQGQVILEAIIDETGTVLDLKVLKGLGMGLDESALEAVSTWRFEPARHRGRPVAVIYSLVINFRLT